MSGFRLHKPADRCSLIEGEALAALSLFTENRFDSCVTDGPYELGFMGKAWDSTGIVNSVEFWREVLRVLKPGAHLLAFGGTRTYHRMACAIEDAGFEVRDSLHWFYGTGFPKSKTANSGMPVGQGTALKPAHEPIVLARKPLIGTIAKNIAAHGTGGLQIDASRIATTDRIVPFGSPKASSGGIMNGQPQYRDQFTQDSAGRWPANVLLDEASAAELDEQTGHLREGGTLKGGESGHAVVSGLAMGPREAWTPYGGSGGASRFFYVAKPGRSERDQGCDHLPAKTGGEATDRADGSPGTQSPRAGAGRTGGARNFHPTVKPVEIMRYLVRLVTPVGGTVLDPFTGSGTTGMAARLEGLSFVGIEREPDYATIAAARIAGAA